MSFVALPEVCFGVEIFLLHIEVNLQFPLPALPRHIVVPFQWLE